MSCCGPKNSSTAASCGKDAEEAMRASVSKYYGETLKTSDDLKVRERDVLRRVRRGPLCTCAAAARRDTN